MTDLHLTASPQLLAAMAAKPLPDAPLLALMRGYESGEVLTVPARRRSDREQRFGGRFTRARYQRSPDRLKSLARRQAMAWRVNVMPNWMCSLLTECERAYAALVREQHERRGYYDLCHDRAAAIIGCASKTVQRAQHRLDLLGWISVEQRPRPGQKHDTNIVRITAPSWLMWIERGGRPSASIGGQRCPATQTDTARKNLASPMPALSALPAARQRASEEGNCKFSASRPGGGEAGR